MQVDDVVASILHWFDTNITGTYIHAGHPDDLDEDDPLLTSWYEPQVSFTNYLVERNQVKHGRVQLQVHCWSKSQTNLYDALQKAAVVEGLFENLDGVNVQDFNTAGDPVVGCLRFKEPRVVDLTQQLGDQRRQAVLVTVEGMVNSV